MTLVHHELCFGCGRTNLFGLQLELEPVGERSLRGRCFIKQDHQGLSPGCAHDGIVAAALIEAMALACGLDATAVGAGVEFHAAAPVGAFLSIEASAEWPDDEGRARARATATSEDLLVAQGSGTYRLS